MKQWYTGQKYLTLALLTYVWNMYTCRKAYTEWHAATLAWRLIEAADEAMYAVILQMCTCRPCFEGSAIVIVT